MSSVARFLNAAEQNLGHLETQALHDVQALLRATTQRAAQAKADATPPRCPVCGQPLRRCSAGHARTFQTRFDDITIQRTRGYCQRCRKWRTPADTALGLEDTAGYSPAVQHLAAVGRALWGEDQEPFQVWLKPLVRQLKNQSAVKVIRQLDEARAGLPAGPDAETVAKEIAYLKTHQEDADGLPGGAAGG